MMGTNDSVGSLEEEAKKRKQRLEALRNKQNVEQKSDENETQATKESLPKPKFRSYHPQDESLKAHALPKIVPESVAEQLEKQLPAAKPEPLIDEVDLTTLAPRKVDWDLKRNLAKKMDRLEKRTQRAIAELIRERLKSDPTDNLLEATHAMESAKRAEDEDED